jgi:YbbR domain-containing protein
MLAALTRHWELKLLALVFSVALWLFVMTSEKTNAVLPLSIELHSLPAGLVVTGEQPETVEVQVHGLRTALARVSPESMRVRVSLAGSRPGEMMLRLGPEQIIVPAGVTVLRVNPDIVRIELARER